jgi:hypothetical protein
MKHVLLVPCLLLFTFIATASPLPSRSQSAAAQQAKEALARCVAALGGADRLRAVDAISYQSFEHTFLHAVDISSSLPGMLAYSRDDGIVQPRLQNISVKLISWSTESSAEDHSSVVSTPNGGFNEDGGKKIPFNADSVHGVIDTLAENPISSLLAALDAPELTLLSQSGDTDEVAFVQSIYGQPVKTTLGISRTDSFLQWVQIEHSSVGDIFSATWGNTTVKRVVYSSWILDPSGLYFPMKWEVFADGLPESQNSFYSAKFNPEVPASTFDIPADVKVSFDKVLSVPPSVIARRYNHGTDVHLDVADGIVMAPGRAGVYNSMLVKQNDGIVIIEAPLSNANSEYMIAYAQKLFPGASINGVVTTNQFWLHVAGLAAYAKIHIPIYVLDSNADLVQQVLTAQAKSDPSLAVAPKLRLVHDRVEIGKGANRMVLLPFRGAESARMMAVYFPERRLLYASDMDLPQAWGGLHWTENLTEIRALIGREHLEVQQVVGVSMPPQDWKQLSASIPAPAAAPTLSNGRQMFATCS